MQAYVRVAEAAQYLNVCTKTIRHWDGAGILVCVRTPGNHRRIAIGDFERLIKGTKQKAKAVTTAIYCRVSSHEQKQKGDLQRHQDVGRKYCQQRRYANVKEFVDVGSGLNTGRKGLSQ